MGQSGKYQIGYVLQMGGLIPFVSVRENAYLPFRILGVNPDKERVETLAGRLGIDNELDKMPEQLSGGQRQRAAILRALGHRPRLVTLARKVAAVKSFCGFLMDHGDLTTNPTAAIDSPRAPKPVPKPLTTPVEFWQPIVSASERAMDFMAKHDIKGIIRKS